MDGGEGGGWVCVWGGGMSEWGLSWDVLRVAAGKRQVSARLCTLYCYNHSCDYCALIVGNVSILLLRLDLAVIYTTIGDACVCNI